MKDCKGVTDIKSLEQEVNDVIQQQNTLWSVWRRGAMRTNNWKCLLETVEEPYARSIFRYFFEDMREGTIELRVDGTAQEQLTKTRKETADERGQQPRQEVLKEKYSPSISYVTLDPIAAVNGVFGPIYDKYKTGKLSYMDMLVEAVIALSDWNKVGLFVEDALWEAGSENFPVEKITTVREAKKQLARYLQSSYQNMEQAGKLINYLFSDPAFEYIFNRVIHDIDFMETLIDSK